MFGSSLPAVILLFPLKFHLICAQVLSQSRSWWGLLRGFLSLCLWLSLSLFTFSSTYVWQRSSVIHTPARAFVRRVCVCVYTRAHLIRLVCVHERARGPPCICLRACHASKVSHLSGRWLRVANGRLDRWAHCSMLAALASVQVTASPARRWRQCWWVAGGLTTLFWWQNDCAVRFTTSLAFFRFVSLCWEVYGVPWTLAYTAKAQFHMGK